MVVESSSHFLGRLRRFINSCRGSDLEDEQLLRRFWQRQDEAAFEALVHRHGTMVLGVCRRVLGDVQFASISAGGEHACGLSLDQVLYCWGGGGEGQIGAGSTMVHSSPGRVRLQ